MKGLSPGMPNLPCMCASLRRASRALTQIYEDELRPLGLRASQFTILQVLSQTGEVSQNTLGQILAMDSTTLTRTLEIMSRHRWITKRYGKDRRERLLRLDKAGDIQLNRALPHWEKIQGRLRSQLGNERWADFLKFTNEVTRVATE